MNKLSKFIIGSFFWPFLLTFSISVFVLLMQFLWVYIDDIIGKGLAWYIIAELLIYTSANLIPLALPLGVLLASIMTFGNIGEHFELTALKSSGISLFKTITPLFIFVIGISISSMLFDNYLIPKANLRYYSLLFDIRSQKPGINIKPDVFYKEITDITIRVKEKIVRKEGDLLKGIMIYNHVNSFGNKKLTLADSGTFKLSKNKKYIIFNLYNGIDYQENTDDIAKTTFTKLKFDKYSLLINLKGFNLERSDKKAFKNDVKMLTMSQMKAQIDTFIKLRNVQTRSIISQIEDEHYFPNQKLDSNAKKIAFHKLLDTLNPTASKKIITMSINSVRNILTKFELNKSFFEINDTKISNFFINFHKKITLSLACIAMFLIGAPLGALVKKGGLGLPIVISIICFLIFWSISITAEKMAIQGIISEFLGAWTPLLIMLPIGLLLLFKASRK